MHRLTPYVPGEQPSSTRLIKLNTNENPYPPSPTALAVLDADVGPTLRLYPDPSSSTLRKTVAERYRLESENVFAGNGSDEVLALSFLAFFKSRAGSATPLQFPDISYSFYPVWARMFEIECDRVPLRADFTLDLSRYRNGRGGIVFPNPNAPTGIAIGLDEIERLLRDVPNRVVVIDEAYVDFGAESAASLVTRYDNLLVVQTLSKSHALAGLRVGFAMGSRELIEGLDRVKSSFNSYPIDRIAERMACRALADDAYFESSRDRVVTTRAWTIEQLSALGFDVLPSSANFVFAHHSSHPATALRDGLRARDILVRHFALARIDDYLRITIGTDEQMKQLIEVLQSLVARA